MGAKESGESGKSRERGKRGKRGKKIFRERDAPTTFLILATHYWLLITVH